MNLHSEIKRELRFFPAYPNITKSVSKMTLRPLLLFPLVFYNKHKINKRRSEYFHTLCFRAGSYQIKSRKHKEANYAGSKKSM